MISAMRSTHESDLLRQTITTGLRFTRQDVKQHAIEVSESSRTTRYTFGYEAVHLLHRCGFDVESITGDYRVASVSENSQHVCLASPIEREKASGLQSRPR